MRVCAIDVGTNTVVSVVADVADDGRLTILADEERFARLGQGVDASGRLAPEAMDRAVDRIAGAQATAEQLGAERVVIGATSASRDASNVSVLRDRVRDELGLDYRVLPGVEEAALSFRGALALLPDVDEATVVDVGGGSTEVVAGTRAGGVAYRTSLDVGSVRLSERHFAARPPAPPAVRAAQADADAALATVDLDAAGGLPVLSTGSVSRILARLAGARAFPPFVPLADAEAWRDRMLGLTPAGVLALAPDALGGREDVAPASVLVLAAAVRALGAEGFVATPGALRHGLALWAAETA